MELLKLVGAIGMAIGLLLIAACAVGGVVSTPERAVKWLVGAGAICLMGGFIIFILTSMPQ